MLFFINTSLTKRKGTQLDTCLAVSSSVMCISHMQVAAGTADPAQPAPPLIHIYQAHSLQPIGP